MTIKDGALDGGEFAHVYFIDWDHVRGRKRQLNITVMGTTDDVEDRKWNNGELLIRYDCKNKVSIMEYYRCKGVSLNEANVIVSRLCKDLGNKVKSITDSDFPAEINVYSNVNVLFAYNKSNLITDIVITDNKYTNK
jgi:hypothetical protein